MKKNVSITFLLLSIAFLFVSSAETKRSHVGMVQDTDLGVTKSGPDVIAPNANITYTITVINAGPDDAVNAAMNDVLPTDLTFVSLSSPAGWSCSTPGVGVNGTITCTNPSLGVTSGDVFTLVAKVGAGATPGTFISNKATISSDTPDTNDENDSSTSSALVMGTSADLGVTKVTSADTLPANSDVTYTITVTNAGPDTADNVALNDALPGSMAFVSLSSPAGWSCTTPSVGSSGAVSCTKPSLTVASGAQVFNLVGHIPAGTANGTVYTFAATVSTSSTDPTSENDSSTAGVTVMCVTDPVVTTNADSGPGSLRRAIQDACPGSNITFDMTPGHVVSPITLTSAELALDKDLAITGPGANTLTVQRSAAGGTPQFRIFNIQSGTTVSISGLTISGGNIASANGGGILNNSTLTLTNIMVSGNTVTNGNGGGIFNNSVTLTLTNSTVSGNIVHGGSGGGIYASGGTINLTNSTVTGNATDVGSGSPVPNPGQGGGIFNLGGTLTVTNSTVSGNTTIGGGTGSVGGGIFNSGGTTNIRNTIVANNAGANGPDLFGSFNSQDYNLIGNTTDATFTGTTTHNIVNQSANLGALANNNGPTQTMLPLPGSPAINAGDPANLPPDTFDADGDTNTAETLPIDQRGFPRVAGANFDIGAVETNYSISATAGTPQSTTITTAFATNLQANVKESGTNQNGIPVTFTAPLAGASGTFPGPSATAVVSTIGGGVATAPTFTANGTAGSYNVIAGIGTGLPTATFALTNTKAATTTTVSSLPNPSNVGQSVTFTATVTSTAGTPTGTVQFKDGGTILGSPQPLNGSGVATFSTSSLTAGVHAITGDYSGDTNFTASSGTLSGGQTVGSVIRFSSATYNTTEGSGFATITVQRIGDLSQAVTVDYTTPDNSSATTVLPCSTPGGVASPRCDFETALGTLRFAAGDGASKTFTVLINQDNFVEGPETLTLTLSNLTGGAAFSAPGATTSTATLTIADDVTEPATNPIDDTDTFVRQQYRDFLNREADPTGLQFWTDNINKCNDPARRPAGLTVPQCTELFRINTSAAFYVSIEFQQSGYYVYRLNKAAFGDIAPPTVPVPVRFSQLTRDAAEVNRGVIVGQGAWQAQLDQNKQALALAFVQRPEFLSRYPGSTSATTFVDSLNGNAGSVLSAGERSALISELSPNPADSGLRADVLMKVAENAVLQQREFNRAFVLMEYFGYLRRNPDAAPEPSLNFGGFNFWLNKLNQFGNFNDAEMVKAFISSAEYRQRFGP